jgi:hypothetical protein
MNRTILFLSFVAALPLLQAQPVVAPSPDHTGSPRGENWGAYNVTDSFETGYRFTTIGGDASLFHNTENYGNGLRLFGTNFTMNSKEGHGLLFDSLNLTATGLGNDPYGAATLRVEKNDVYRYDVHWRKSSYNNLPLDNGASANLMNTQRVLQDHDLSVTLAQWAKLQLGYSRVHQYGPQDSTYEAYIGGLARSVLPILQNVRRDFNGYRVGTQLDFLGFRLTLSHQWEYSKDDTTTDPLVPGQPYGLPLSQPFQPALPVTYPTLVTAYNRTQPMHGLNRVWFANLNRSTKWWAVNARMTYSKADMTSMYYETESGARQAANSTCSNCGSGVPTSAYTYAPGSARRPFTAGDFTFSLFPTSRLTIVNSTSAQNNRYDGVNTPTQIVNNVAAVKSVYWNYRIGDQRFSDALEANYRVAKWLGLHAEYRYTARWLVNNLIRTGTTNSKDLNKLNNHLNAGTFGIRIKPLKPLSLDVDTTIGRDNSPLNPISPAHYQNIRARAEYRQSKRLRFGAAYRQMYNLNAPDPVVFTSTYGPPPNSYYASHSRDLSFSSSFTLSNHWAVDASYNKRHLDTFANLWSEQPAPNSVTIVSVPGYISRYISNLHTVSFIARTSIEKRGTLYLGYNITRDTGDGRAVQNLGLTNPAASFMAGLNTFPMTYQAPMARLSIKLSEKLQWNGGWEFFRYNQKFAYFGYMPYYRAQTGYTSITWTF